VPGHLSRAPTRSVGPRLHLVDGRSDQILYILPEPDPAGRTALRLSALEFLDRLATILPPPRIHRHRYHGVFAPNAPLRPLVTARALEDNALAAQVSGLDVLPPAAPEVPAPQPEMANRKAPDTTPSRPSRWAALLARIYEVFPLICPTCQTPLTFIAFIADPEPISLILAHIGEPTSPPTRRRHTEKPTPIGVLDPFHPPRPHSPSCLTGSQGPSIPYSFRTLRFRISRACVVESSPRRGRRAPLWGMGLGRLEPEAAPAAEDDGGSADDQPGTAQSIPILE